MQTAEEKKSVAIPRQKAHASSAVVAQAAFSFLSASEISWGNSETI